MTFKNCLSNCYHFVLSIYYSRKNIFQKKTAVHNKHGSRFSFLLYLNYWF